MKNNLNGSATQRDASQDIASPSKITPLHVRSREISKVAGAPRAWKKLSQLQAAYLQERLGPKASDLARDRLAAGNAYTKFYDCSQKGSGDSTQGFISGGIGQREAFTLAQQSALGRLVAIHKHLGERDRIIVESVCAFGYSPSEAIGFAKLGKDTRVSARLCEALDALADAIERTERRGRR